MMYIEEMRSCCRDSLGSIGEWCECTCGAKVAKFADTGANRTFEYASVTDPPPQRVAIIVVNKAGDVLHGGHEVLWRGLDYEQGVALCSDARTIGKNYFLAWTDESRLADAPRKEQEGRITWRWTRDDGRHDHVLAEHGLGPGPWPAREEAS